MISLDDVYFITIYELWKKIYIFIDTGNEMRINSPRFDFVVIAQSGRVVSFDVRSWVWLNMVTASIWTGIECDYGKALFVLRYQSNLNCTKNGKRMALELEILQLNNIPPQL